ncbi:MAG: MerR family transcriptional regulator [Rhizobiales bacterium]|nr:MerR family transcriptional regulator [Hyphomicrobiales bacterium]
MADQTEGGDASNYNEKAPTPEQGRPWTISEMADEFNVSYRTLRFYEQKSLLAPRRRGNARLYSLRDFVHMKIITKARRIGMPLVEVGEILNAYHQARGKEIQEEMVAQRLAQHLMQLQEQRDLLNEQISETSKFLADRDNISC